MESYQVNDKTNPQSVADELKLGKSILRKRKAKTYLFILSIIGLQLVNLIVFYFGVNINSILMAFQIKQDAGKTWIWSLDNFANIYKQFFVSGSSSELWIALGNTFKFFGLSLVMFPIAFSTSYFMYKKILGHGIFKIVFFFPSIVSGVVWSTLYKEIVGPQGPIIQMFLNFGWFEEPIVLLDDIRYALGTVMVYSVWMGIAGGFILYGGALSRIPTEVIEAGQLDGINWFNEMVRVIIPLIFPTMGTMLLLQLCGLFTASGNILLLTGGARNTSTISFLIFANVYKVPETSNKYNYASAVGLVFTTLTIPIVFIVRYFLNKIEDVEY